MTALKETMEILVISSPDWYIKVGFLNVQADQPILVHDR